MAGNALIPGASGPALVASFTLSLSEASIALWPVVVNAQFLREKP